MPCRRFLESYQRAAQIAPKERMKEVAQPMIVITFSIIKPSSKIVAKKLTVNEKAGGLKYS